MRSAMVLAGLLTAQTVLALGAPAGAIRRLDLEATSEPPRKGLNRMLSRSTPQRWPLFFQLNGKKPSRPWIRRGRRHRRRFTNRRHRRFLQQLRRQLRTTYG